MLKLRWQGWLLCALCPLLALPTWAQEPKSSNKPVLHGQHWVAITGKPLAATAGALTFARGGNAVDAACAMLGATATMWDTLGWGGETQALIHDPRSGEVKAINALGAAPTGATPEYFRARGLRQPPEFGPLAAVTPGTAGGLMVMLAEFGTMSLEEVLQPALQMAAGFPVEKKSGRFDRIQQGFVATLGCFAPHPVAPFRYECAARLRGAAPRRDPPPA